MEVITTIQEIVEPIFKKSIEVYGKEAQSRQAMEECAELIQAINKCLRYPNKEEWKNDCFYDYLCWNIIFYHRIVSNNDQ